MANTGKIERAAVRAVEVYLDECPKLEPSISKADKNKIWDGVINIFDKEEQKVSQFFAQVPLQVKGTESTKEINYFRLGRDYVKGYKKVNGTAFFLVQKGKGKVYYAFLSVEIIDTLLQQTTQTIKIPLQEVPTNPLDFEQELYDFAASRNSEKVEKTSPKEIQKLVEGFEGLRGHLKEIKDRNVRAQLKTHLDSIKNLSEDTQDDDTVGWRDSFYFCSREAIDLAINHIKGHDFTKLQFNLGYYLDDQKQYHLAEKYYRNALEEYRKRSDIVNVAMTLNNLGNLHSDLTRYAEAEEEYKEALAIRRELADTNRDVYIGYVADTLNNLAILHDDLNRKNEAEEEYKEALAIYRELAETNRDAYIGDVAMTLNNLGNLHNKLIRYAEAEEEYKEALAIRRELAKTNRDAYIEYVATTLNNLAIQHKSLTRYDEAEEEYKEALAIYRELAKTNRDAYIGYVAMILENIARLQKATNRKAEAKKTAEEALAIYQKLADTYPQIWNKDVEDTERLL